MSKRPRSPVNGKDTVDLTEDVGSDSRSGSPEPRPKAKSPEPRKEDEEMEFVPASYGITPTPPKDSIDEMTEGVIRLPPVDISPQQVRWRCVCPLLLRVPCQVLRIYYNI